jgi:diguanylate cyclase (GGDEF)-like protein
VNRPLVVVAEDSLVVRAMVCRQLADAGFRVAEAGDGEEALQVCRERFPAVVLLDMEMPRLDGREVLRQMKEDPALASIPVVFLTGRTHTDDMVDALRLGAHDYLGKPFENAELLARVSAAARVKALHDELQLRADELDRLTRLDMLTGLHNRRHLDEHLRAFVSAARRHQQALGVLMVDIDHFKLVNDTYGHAAGDEVLCEVSRRLSRVLRTEDVAGRWGGEEFLVLLPQTGVEGATVAAERIRVGVADSPVKLADGTLDVTVSVGATAAVPDDGETLVQRADAALYEAKAAGRNRTVTR